VLKRRHFQTGMALAGLTASGARAAMPDVAGDWTGALNVNGGTLRLRLHIAPNGSVSLTGMGPGGVLTDGQVTASGEQIVMNFRAPKAAFTGEFNGRDRLEGTWRQGPSNVPLNLTRGAAGASDAVPPMTLERIAVLRAQSGSPALAAASMRTGGPPIVWSSGERRAGSGMPVDNGDSWHLGSVTMSVTATLVARLAEAGAIGWDDTAGALLGAAAPAMHPSYRGVTFRHLLSHRSGLPRNLPLAQFKLYARDLSDPREERREYTRQALAMEPLGPPAATYAYSNSGYIVAGAMLEARLGASWEALIAAHLFQPLGLGSAGFGAPGRKGGTDQPVGHAMGEAGGGLVPFPPGAGIGDNPAVMGPAGRIHMNLHDLLRYLGAHRDRSGFLRLESWATLQTPPFGGNYAMGWIVRDDGSLWHDGSNTLWYAEILCDRSRGVVAAAVANDGYVDKVAPAVARALREAAAGV
jgi:CubicO group peptidase (beta-lactamase class C family)